MGPNLVSEVDGAGKIEDSSVNSLRINLKILFNYWTRYNLFFFLGYERLYAQLFPNRHTPPPAEFLAVAGTELSMKPDVPKNVPLRYCDQIRKRPVHESKIVLDLESN